MLLSELLPLPLPVHAVQVNIYVRLHGRNNNNSLISRFLTRLRMFFPNFEQTTSNYILYLQSWIFAVHVSLNAAVFRQ